MDTKSTDGRDRASIAGVVRAGNYQVDNASHEFAQRVRNSLEQCRAGACAAHMLDAENLRRAELARQIQSLQVAPCEAVECSDHLEASFYPHHLTPDWAKRAMEEAEEMARRESQNEHIQDLQRYLGEERRARKEREALQRRHVELLEVSIERASPAAGAAVAVEAIPPRRQIDLFGEWLLRTAVGWRLKAGLHLALNALLAERQNAVRLAQREAIERLLSSSGVAFSANLLLRFVQQHPDIPNPSPSPETCVKRLKAHHGEDFFGGARIRDEEEAFETLALAWELGCEHIPDDADFSRLPAKIREILKSVELHE